MKQQLCRVLLVEDNKISQRIPLLLLEQWQATIDVAETGYQAQALAAMNCYDLIFMDIGLPDMSGLESAKLIRNHSGFNHNTPIIALTAHKDDILTDHLGNTSFNAVFQKPLTHDICHHLFHHFVGQKRAVNLR